MTYFVCINSNTQLYLITLHCACCTNVHCWDTLHPIGQANEGGGMTFKFHDILNEKPQNSNNLNIMYTMSLLSRVYKFFEPLQMSK